MFKRFAKAKAARLPGTMNKIEAEYWLRLQREERLGLIREIGYQRITLKLGQDCRYTPDFDFVDTHGAVTLVEVKAGRKDKDTGKVKAFSMDDSTVKLKTAATQFPQFRFVLTWAYKGQWAAKEIE